MPGAQRGGFPTWWMRYGHGPRKALLIHRALCDCTGWGRLADALSGALTMTAFDLPGHGRSGAWDGRAEVQALSTRIAADLADGPDGPSVVIGHGFGATVALRLAVERPDLVRALVLIEPVVLAVALQDHSGGGSLPVTGPPGFAAAMAAGDHWRAARAFIGFWDGDSAWEALPVAQKHSMAARMPLVAAGQDGLCRDAAGMLEPGVLAAVAAPALLIEGSLSPPVIAAVNQGLAARLPRGARAVIMGAGHMAPITHAPQLAAEILLFLGAG